MIICGYGLSTAATVALGIDQTYFGVELGEVLGQNVRERAGHSGDSGEDERVRRAAAKHDDGQR